MSAPYMGGVQTPIGTDSYKRAIYRPPPRNFAVEMLGAAKQGASHSYGMRIYPLADGDRRSLSTSTDYDIWRRWEDCLLFQNTLETEYRERARAKRQRLVQGKGVKRNGLYLQDQAASWESLPPGPDPNSVALKISEYLPTLSKKNTIFRASQTTVDQRAAELKTLIEALFRLDVPTLIDELRSERVVLDFFGYWRRDFELAEKERKHKGKASKNRTSISSSIFATYFSSSELSTPQYAGSLTSADCSFNRRPSPSKSDSQNSPRNSTDSSGSSMFRGRQRAYSSASSTYSPSTYSDGSLESPVRVSMVPPDVVEDTASATYDPYSEYNPYQEYTKSTLDVLPEDGELSLKGVQLGTPATKKRRKNSTGESNPVRNGMIFLAPPPVPPKDLKTPTSVKSDIRQSWQTVDTITCMLEGMHLEIPPTPTDVHRVSISSIATFQTNCSLEGVCPRSAFDSSPSPGRPRPSPRGVSRKSRVVSCPISVSEFEDEWSDPEEDILDEFFSEAFPVPSSEVPQDIIVPNHTFVSHGSAIPSPPCSPLSANSTTSADCRRPIAPQQFVIKAGYRDAFIVLRVPCEMSYKELRTRLYNKFVGVEGMPLSDKFGISFVQPLTTNNTLDHSETPDSETNTLFTVTSEGDWECVTTSIEGNKLTLRISDPVC